MLNKNVRINLKKIAVVKVCIRNCNKRSEQAKVLKLSNIAKFAAPPVDIVGEKILTAYQ